MGNKTYDPIAFRRFEHEGWERLYAGYHHHWEHLTTQAIPQMLDATDVGKGTYLLDLASGPGYVSAAAAKRGANTVGLDFSDNMRRLAKESNPNLTFEFGDAENLQFPDETFDCVLINFGVLHFPDADKALSEAHRVLSPGGRLAFTAWAGPENSAIGIAMGAIADEGSLEVDLPAGTPVFRFADHEECKRTLGGIGFGETACVDMLLTWRLPGPDKLMESFQEATARTSGLLAAQDPAVLPAIAAAMTEGCEPFHKDGQTDLPMPAVLTVGTKA